MNHKPDPDKLAQAIAESAQQIWSAGLDALSLAEKESSRFFDTLSKLGENIQSHTEKTAGRAAKTVAGGKNTATETWDKLEEMFELRVARVLNGLQIPTARDIKELTERVDKLSKIVEKLNAEKAADDKAPKARKRRKKTRKKAATGKKDKKSSTRKKKKKAKDKSAKKKARKKRTRS